MMGEIKQWWYGLAVGHLDLWRLELVEEGMRQCRGRRDSLLRVKLQQLTKETQRFGRGFGENLFGPGRVDRGSAGVSVDEE